MYRILITNKIRYYKFYEEIIMEDDRKFAKVMM